MQRFIAPQPIRTTTDNAFAHDTMARRFPANIRTVAAADPEYSQPVAAALEDLAIAVESDAPMPSLTLPAWDADRWRAPYERRAGETWQNSDMFFAETYGFRLLLHAVRYFQTGVDPFGPMKQRELDSGAAFSPLERFFGSGAAGAFLERPELSRAERRLVIEEALHLATWGNKADISFAAGGELDHDLGDRDLLLVDDGAAATDTLIARSGSVHMVMDNSGAELAGDLALAVVLMRLLDAPVVLHPKFYPTYVSDTTVADIHLFLQRAGGHSNGAVRTFAGYVSDALDTGALGLAPDPYWCETAFLDAMPDHLAGLFAGARMVIVKGDFNYRRAFRDTTWPVGTEPAAAMGLAAGRSSVAAAAKVPWLFLRTMKSDCLVGVGEADWSDLDTREPGWCTAGKRAVMQLVG